MILSQEKLDQLSQEQTAGLLSACGYAIREQATLSAALRELGFHVSNYNDEDCFLLEESVDLVDESDLAQLAVSCAQKLGIIAHKQKKSTPKTLGYIARETWELFEAGWQHADKFVKQRQEEASHKKDAQGCVRLLEIALYDSASRGNAADKVKALNYFKSRSQLPLSEPLLGEHMLSGFIALCTISLICLGGMFSAKMSCGSKGSGFCGDVHTITTRVTSYFTESRK